MKRSVLAHYRHPQLLSNGSAGEVEIFGENNSILTLSECAQTIPYELLCSVSKRVPRVYK